ncbi:MAG TPA: LamG domain-containing protein [Williamwhitmania sp.]|nr:LamG domain-containing protein [Williamwhitmania sp.]
MKEQVQQTGVRKWFGDDLVSLQVETLDAFQSFLQDLGPVIIQGLSIDGSNLGSGVVAISHADGYKVARFAGLADVAQWPVYVFIEKIVETREYGDTQVKPVSNTYRATFAYEQPAVPFLTINQNGNNAFYLDTILADAAKLSKANRFAESQRFDKKVGIGKDADAGTMLDVNGLTQLMQVLLQSFSSSDFVAGMNGQGFSLDENGRMEIKSLLVRNDMTVFELIVQKLRSVGGMLIVSVANGQIKEVEAITGGYRCTLDKTTEMQNPFVVGDLVKCQMFNGNVKYYWRKVVAVDTDTIDLSDTDKDGTGVPEAGDTIVQLGHSTDVTRQNAIVIDATAIPKIDILQGISGFSLTNKVTTRLGDMTDFGMTGMGLYTNNAKFTGYSEKTEVDAIAAGLQAQIDGTISSWFFDYEPTLDNVPAVNWGDAQVMEIHLGDLFYWTSMGYAYRFQKVGSVFSWARIADTDITLALANAASAQASANTANALLADIASDGKLTPNEKQSTKKEWAIIQAEFSGVESAADNLSLIYDDYDDAYYALNAYIIPLLANMTTTSVIDAATFNGMFSTYYTRKLEILNAISAAINLTASAALNQANAVFPSDEGLVAHWSFDDDPIIPDGSTPAYLSADKWVKGLDGWSGNSGVAVSVELGAIKADNPNNDNGASIERGWSESLRGKSAIIKVRSKNPILSFCYYSGSDLVHPENPVVIDQYNWFVRLDNIQVNSFPYLFFYVNNGVVGETAWFDLIWIGNVSFASEVRDNSGNGNTLSAANGSIAAPSGVSGNSRRFNGTEYLSTDSTKFRLPAFSFSVWFNSPGMAAGQTAGGIWANTFFCRLFQQPNGTISWWLCDGASWYDVYSTKTLFGSWHHAACIFDGTTMYLYIDGILHAYRTATLQYHSNEFFVGYDPNDVPYHFNGLLDEARFYSRALNSNEVLGLYKYVTKGKAVSADIEASYLKKAFSEDTSITGGVVASTLLKVGATNSNGDWTEQAGINGAGTGADTPRVYAGGSLQDAINRVAGNTSKPMSVITEGGAIYTDSGEIAGAEITPEGIEKEQSISDGGATFTGKFKLDFVNQLINFLRDGSSKLLLSAKKLTSGIPTPTNINVGSGTWQNEVLLNANPYTSIMGTIVYAASGAYDTTAVFSMRVDAPEPGATETRVIAVSLSVMLKIWATDSSGNKLYLLASKSVYLNIADENAHQLTVKSNFTVENATYVRHEIYIQYSDTSYIYYAGPHGVGSYNNPILCSVYLDQGTVSHAGNTENFEIGYSGLRILAQNLWFYFNTKDTDSKHLRIRGNAELINKMATQTLTFGNGGLAVNRLTVAGLLCSIRDTAGAYSMLAADKDKTCINCINTSGSITVTLPDMNATEVVDGQTIYYNDGRVLLVTTNTQGVSVVPVSGQTVRNTSSVSLSYNTGFMFIADRARLNWLIVGVG